MFPSSFMLISRRGIVHFGSSDDRGSCALRCDDDVKHHENGANEGYLRVVVVKTYP